MNNDHYKLLVVELLTELLTVEKARYGLAFSVHALDLLKRAGIFIEEETERLQKEDKMVSMTEDYRKILEENS